MPHYTDPPPPYSARPNDVELAMERLRESADAIWGRLGSNRIPRPLLLDRTFLCSASYLSLAMDEHRRTGNTAALTIECEKELTERTRRNGSAYTRRSGTPMRTEECRVHLEPRVVAGSLILHFRADIFVATDREVREAAPLHMVDMSSLGVCLHGHAMQRSPGVLFDNFSLENMLFNGRHRKAKPLVLVSGCETQQQPVLASCMLCHSDYAVRVFRRPQVKGRPELYLVQMFAWQELGALLGPSRDDDYLRRHDVGLSEGMIWPRPGYSFGGIREAFERGRR